MLVVNMSKPTSPIKTYAAVGRCIYCGIEGVRLGEEHIIPFGLNGNIVLPSSSCDDCSRITGRFEGVCQRKLLGNIRIKLGLKTRRKKDRPAKLEIYIKTPAGETVTEVDVVNYPHMFAVPILDEARILLGAPEFHSDLIGCGIWANVPEEEVRPYIEKERHGLRVGAVQADVFCRMLAKIAYSFATAELGYGNFRPLILPIILGKSSNYGHLIGGLPQAPEPSAQLHEVSLEYRIVGLQVYIVVNVRLFGQAGAPQYHVVVGTGELLNTKQKEALEGKALLQASPREARATE
ncbi:hypothetical protein [Methylobacterium sp. 22177]|uniref:hypothetical protein n=1 Tax=Methylobacterium sp. 22177 TaxID=3453885 RepID=UPI003F8641EE